MPPPPSRCQGKPWQNEGCLGLSLRAAQLPMVGGEGAPEVVQRAAAGEAAQNCLCSARFSLVLP